MVIIQVLVRPLLFVIDAVSSEPCSSVHAKFNNGDVIDSHGHNDSGMGRDGSFALVHPAAGQFLSHPFQSPVGTRLFRGHLA